MRAVFLVFVALCGTCGLTPAPALGQAPTAPPPDPILFWHGEVRPRFESREPVEGEWSRLISQRTRLTLEVGLAQEGLRIVLQPQDVRAWGEELSVRDRSADNLGIHQAYLEVEDLPLVRGLLRAGRQEAALAESRLLASPDWGQGGQSFDGLRWIRHLGSRRNQRLDLLFFQLQEDASPAHDRDAHLLGAWYALETRGVGSWDIYALRDDGRDTGSHRENILGGIWKGSIHPFGLRAQGIYQFGKRDGRDVEAFLLAARAGVALADEALELVLWYDFLSGDHRPGDDEIRVFSTLFGARHRYYGRADYFVDIPVQTGGLGLQDLAFKVAWTPRDRLALNLDLHLFLTATADPRSRHRLAQEADGWIRYRAREHLALEAGYSLVQAGPVMEGLERLEGIGHFGYLMTSVRF
jgi:hypothetical protein